MPPAASASRKGKGVLVGGYQGWDRCPSADSLVTPASVVFNAAFLCYLYYGAIREPVGANLINLGVLTTVSSGQLCQVWVEVSQCDYSPL